MFTSRNRLRLVLSVLTLSVLALPLFAGVAAAQSADDIIEKHLAALGGREALGKLTSRHATGTVTISSQAGDLSGSIETFAKVPNKTRVLMKLDLSAMGGGEVVVEQLFDGTSGYTLNSMQGDSEITGTQLDNMRNGAFPTAMLRYKEAGTKIELLPREKVAGKDAIVLLVTPKTGSVSRLFLDPETYLTIRTVAKIAAPQVGEIEQTNEVSDYRTMDGVKVPFRLSNSNPLQTLTVVLKSVEHNVPIDDAMFGKK